MVGYLEGPTGDRHTETVAHSEDSGSRRLLMAAKDMKLLADIATASQVDAPLTHTERTHRG